MEITLNGEFKEIPEDMTAAQLVEFLELEGRRLAIEINEEIVPRSSYEACRLNPGDQVEIVHAIGGG